MNSGNTFDLKKSLLRFFIPISIFSFLFLALFFQLSLSEFFKFENKKKSHLAKVLIQSTLEQVWLEAALNFKSLEEVNPSELRKAYNQHNFEKIKVYNHSGVLLYEIEDMQNQALLENHWREFFRRILPVDNDESRLPASVGSNIKKMSLAQWNQGQQEIPSSVILDLQKGKTLGLWWSENKDSLVFKGAVIHKVMSKGNDFFIEGQYSWTLRVLQTLGNVFHLKLLSAGPETKNSFRVASEVSNFKFEVSNEDQQKALQFMWVFMGILFCFFCLILIKFSGIFVNKIAHPFQDYLVQAEKMSSLGRLLAGVSHEMNNPLSYMNSNLLQLVKYNKYFVGCSSPDELKQRVGPAEWNHFTQDFPDLTTVTLRGCQRLIRIVSDLNFFSKESNVELKHVFLRPLVDEALYVLKSKILSNIKIEVEIDPTLDLHADPQSLSHIFLNLFSNAIDSMEKGGQLKIIATQELDVVHVSVQDTGKGIAPGALEKVFEPFYSTKSQGKGMGLGLSIVYGLVKQHDGKISIQSTLGAGTEFVLEIPRFKKINEIAA